MSPRLKKRLDALKAQGRAGFVPFVMAGDPSVEAAADILRALPAHGADIIELGVPFSDPMADGPVIQAAAIRALEAGCRIDTVFKLVRDFRATDADTPIVLMGYFNPIFSRGVERFMREAHEAGADALIIVDLPTEELTEAQPQATAHQLDVIRLIAPTSLDTRLSLLANGASGFLYYIAVKGVTGDKSADYGALAGDVARIRAASALPIAVGFGIKTAEDVKKVAESADLVVVGSRIVSAIAESPTHPVQAVLEQCKILSGGLGK